MGTMYTIKGIVESLQLELISFNLCVNLVCLGFVDTGFVDTSK